MTKELSITTEAKATPSFLVKNENVTTGSIDADYDVADVDNILASYKVELYKGSTLVSENVNKAISFASLSYYTDYTLKITYTYDLNDGRGEQSSVFEKAYKTLPYIDVVECSIANTSAVSEGDTIFMSVKLDNPLGMTIESVVINGVTYGVTGASTKNKIFVEIVYNGQFAGGDTYLQVDKVNAKIDATSVSVAPQTELSDNVFINGKLEVLSIEYVDENFKPLADGSWLFPSKTLYVMITLYNPTGYTVDSLSGYTKLDDNHYYCPISEWLGWSPKVSVSAISYHNSYISKSHTITTVSNTYSVYRVASDEVQCISEPSDLLNMNGYYYYELAGDIDLSGIEWRGNSFEGIFNGKGYAIKNMSFVGTIKNQEAYLGLFKTGNGIIQNVKIEEATIIAEVSADNGQSYSAYCGAFVAKGAMSATLIIDACSVDEYTIISVKHMNGAGSAYIGGFVGCLDSYFGHYYNNRITITNSSNNGAISGTAETGTHSGLCVGGFVASGYNVTIANCTNNGDISATGDLGDQSVSVGGVVGTATGNVPGSFTNCTNNGSISVESNYGEVGGIAGYATGTFASCTNNGSINIKALTTHNGYAGGIVGYLDNGSLMNCTNTGNVIGGNYSGGMIGGTSSYGAFLTLDSCVNSGNISAAQVAGGMIGNGQSNATNCTNSGNISAGHSAGGILGTGDANLENCTNTGSISANEYYAGGMIGQSGGNATITGCTNSGSVSTNGSAAGGMIGRGGMNSKTLTNCTNSGNISAAEYAGGMVGMIEHISNTVITGCRNSGDVSVTGRSSYAGGLMGKASDATIITNCTNTGNITSVAEVDAFAGGLMGYAGAVSITNCTSSGSVGAISTGKEAYVGGLIGYGSNSTTITNCTSSGEMGEIAGAAHAFIGGVQGYGYSIMTNVYSLVSGNEYGNNGTLCTVSQLNSRSFYTDTLGWSEDVWDLSALDVENGKHPMLKD